MTAPRNDSSKLTIPMMLAAFLVIGGFMFYLNQASKAFEVEVVQAGETEEAEGIPGRAVTVAELAGSPEALAGERLRLTDAEVVSRVGQAAFWVEAPGDSYYLIRLLPNLVAQGVNVESGQRATVTGTVHMMGDSVLAAWETEGLISSGQRAEAEFATSFFEADEIQVRSPSGDGDGDGDQDDGEE